MFNKSGFIYVFVVCAVFLFLTFVKGANLREKRQPDIFQTGMALAMDKGLEFVQIVEHGVKFEDKSDHDIDVFGAKIERQNGHKIGYGDSMREDTDDDDRRKKRQSQNPQQGAGAGAGKEFENGIKEVEGAWSQMWSKVVETAKQMWNNVSSKFSKDGQKGQQGQQRPQGQPGQRGQEEQF